MLLPEGQPAKAMSADPGISRPGVGGIPAKFKKIAYIQSG
jgi:hypothetical protein